MTTPPSVRTVARRVACLSIAGTTLLAAAGGASADEGGLGDFLSSIFGAPRPAAPVATPAPQTPAPQLPAYIAPRHHYRARPLVVRLHPARPRLAFSQVPTKPEKVSIFEDRTLRRGDAVMMAGGMRVFAGSASWPYTDADFVALKDAKSLDRATSHELALLDKAPRS